MIGIAIAATTTTTAPAIASARQRDAAAARARSGRRRSAEHRRPPPALDGSARGAAALARREHARATSSRWDGSRASPRDRHARSYAHKHICYRAHMDHDLNVVGAMVVALGDRIRDATEDAAGMSGRDAGGARRRCASGRAGGRSRRWPAGCG